MAADLDNFKRRLIRSVARLQLQEKKQPDKLWEELKKETGYDCRVVWERMRALTLKKLDRLLLADDKPDDVPAIARLTNTDWLLFDLVLVHEKIDVITAENTPPERQWELKPLVDLFYLVQRLNIEDLHGEPLAEAWAAATIYYNTEGRQCSPMLLQRRWYQLKETTRQRFYNFWFSYRGNAHLLISAKKDAPSVLEMAIAKRYGNVITSPFEEWDELIQKKLVVLPQEFESNMRKQNLPKLCDADSPDIVLVEPSIETIDLRMDSDSDEEKDDGTQIASDPEKSSKARDIKVKGNELTDGKGEQTDNIIKRSETVKDITTPNINSQILQEKAKVKIEIPDDYEVVTAPADPSNKVLDDRNLTGSGSDIDEIVLPKISSVYGNVDIHEIETTPSCSFTDNNLLINSNEILEATTKSMNTITADNDRDIECCDFDINRAVKEKIAYFFKNYALANKSSSNVSNSKDTTEANKEVEASEDLIAGNILRQELIRNTQKEITKSKSNEGTTFKNLTEDNILKQSPEDFIRKTQTEMTSRKSNQEAETFKDLTADDILKQRAEEFVQKTQKGMISTKSNKETKTSNDLTADDILKHTAEEFVQKTYKEMISTKSNQETKTSNDLTSNDILKQRAEEFIRKTQKEIIKTSELEKNIETNANLSRYIVETENITSNVSVQNIIDNIVIDDVPKKETVPDSNITNTFDSTNWTLVDDGIELIDDGIEFVDEEETINENVKIENNDKMIENKTEDIDTPKFDLKLLMDPVVYTTKLDLMDLNLKVMELYTIKGEVLINDIIRESKPVSMLSIDVKEIKEEHKDNDSQQSIYSTDKQDINGLFKTKSDDDDSDSEAGISEDRKVGLSSYMLQKPRSRSYNPIQLCKNPDFNTRLKRLPVGFFKSTRNLQLLKTCKPMTIDLHKAFETKLINGTVYLKSASKDTKLCEKQIDQKSERNQTATIVPSAMSVQSLIDNTVVESDLVSSVAVTSNQNISYQTEEALVSERRKVINLPDITSVRRINQRLLTAEVPPIVYQNSDERDKHVETEINGTQSNVENSVSQVSKHIFDSKDNTKVSHLSVLNVARFNNINMQQTQKDKFSTTKSKLSYVPKRRIEVPWSSSMYPVLETTNERLITNDTLEKVLYVLSGNKVTQNENSKKVKNKRLASKGLEAKSKKQKGEKQIDDKQKRESQNNEKQNTNEVNSKKVKEVEVESKMKDITKPKINIKSKGEYCCWYREKISVIEKGKTSNKKTIRISKHSCPYPNCVCCCRDVSYDHIKRIKSSKDIQTDSIVVSDDEEPLELQKSCELQESVNQECCDYTIVADTSLSTCQENLSNNASQFLPDKNRENLENNSNLNIIQSSQHNTIVADTSLSICQENLSNNASQFLPDENRENLENNSNLSIRDIAQESITMVTPTVGKTVDDQSLDETMSTTNVIPPLNTNDKCLRRGKLSVKSTSTINESATQLKTSVMTQVEPPTQLTTCVRDSIENLSNIEKPSFIQQSTSNFPEVPNVENFQRQIVIDGSNHKCIVPSTVVSESGISSLISNDDCKKTPSFKDTPLRIGKNTILLTTAKLPKTNDTIVHENAGLQIVSPTPLPAGVQLLMHPTGELHLVVAPGVELTADQLLALPNIVQEIQRKADGLHISTVHNNSQVNDTAIDETAIDKTTSEIDINSKEKERSTIDEEHIPTSDSIDKDINAVEYQKAVQLNEDNEIRLTKDKNDENLHDNAIQSDVDQSKNGKSNNSTSPNLTSENISEIIEEKTSELDHKARLDNDGNTSTNRKTLLSDLMEMSGISSEDTMISQENITFPQTIHTAEETNLPSSSDNLDTNIISKIPELSVVTSLADLKYACENNGDFFKLNFDTGVLTPVKVHVEKNLTKKLTPIKIDPNTIIDLTEDTESSNEHKSTKRRRRTIKYCKIAPTGNAFRHVSTPPPTNDSIKPLKLFKSMYPIILKRLKLGKKNINTICYDKDVNHRTQNKKQRRKQNFNKIEAKIDLVDSDAPMEEEYLLDSDFGEEIEPTTRARPIGTNDISYDSSDDEPLAKKSKRLKEVENDSNNIVEDRVSKETVDKNLQDCNTTLENKKVDDNNASTSAVVEVSGDTVFENVEYIENEEADNPVGLSFLGNDSEPESCMEEDCILGV